MKPIIIAVGCNCEKFVNKWYKSIINQTVKDFECLIAIDNSKDNTFGLTRDVIKDDSRFKIVAYHEDDNKGALYNRYICTEKVKDTEAIIMHVDLDDAFYIKNAMQIVLNKYKKTGCWLTYGSYIASNKEWSWCRAIPDNVWNKNGIRKFQWCTTALRTFKKWLWDKINKKDFLWPDGSWIKKGTDRAIMYPLVEMAGKAHTCYIKKILYYYNIYPANLKSRRKDKDASKYLIKKNPYKRIKKR